MALLPLLFDDPFFDFRRPSRILDQQFGLGLTPEDLLAPLTRDVQALTRLPTGYLRPWRTSASEADAGSTIQFDKDKFQANLDVQQFSPNEITVKVSGDNEVTIEGKHEEKQDEHGFVSRQFVRRYVLPKDYDVNKIESKLSSDGVLSITAPKTDQKAIGHREIPITQTGKPSKAIESKEQKK